MKKLSLIALAAGTLFTVASCEKNANKVVTNVDPVDSTVTVDTSYTLSGLRDLELNNLGTGTINVTVTRTSGPEKKVSFVIAGLPDTSVIEASGVSSGYTTFTTAIKFVTKFAKPGTYPIRFVATSDIGNDKVYNINLIIKETPKSECNQLFVAATPNALATYSEQEDTLLYGQTAVINNTTQQQLFFYAMLLEVDTALDRTFVSVNNTNGSVIRFTLDCNDGSIMLPEQEILGRSFLPTTMERRYKISGSGQAVVGGHARIKYTTWYDNNGDTVRNTYVIKAPFSID